RVQPDNKADDTSTAILELPGPALGTIAVTYVATGERWSEERRIVGTKGSLLIRDDPEDGFPLLRITRDEVAPVPVQQPLYVNQYGIALTLNHFLRCIVKDEPEEITAQEARAAVATSCAAYESDRRRQRVEIALE
ncbi:MAG: hypothetical protein H5T86_14370, partial [Armatimonadetes bacterium]|nr:hypothetical protein [Armatimonadota bacterium]